MTTALQVSSVFPLIESIIITLFPILNGGQNVVVVKQH